MAVHISKEQDMIFGVKTSYFKPDETEPYSVSYVGPYLNVGPARGMVTRTKREVERYGRAGVSHKVELVVSKLEWVVVE